jgi:hypothetical protein
MAIIRLAHFSSERIGCLGRKRKTVSDVTIIEIRPFRNGWEVFGAPGVEPVVLEARAGNRSQRSNNNVNAPTARPSATSR